MTHRMSYVHNNDSCHPPTSYSRSVYLPLFDLFGLCLASYVPTETSVKGFMVCLRAKSCKMGKGEDLLMANILRQHRSLPNYTHVRPNAECSLFGNSVELYEHRIPNFFIADKQGQMFCEPSGECSEKYFGCYLRSGELALRKFSTNFTDYLLISFTWDNSPTIYIFNIYFTASALLNIIDYYTRLSLLNALSDTVVLCLILKRE